MPTNDTAADTAAAAAAAAGTPTPAPVPSDLRLRRPDRDQLVWAPAALDALIPPGHQARVVWAVVKRLDLSAFAAAIKARAGVCGRDATDPALLVSAVAVRRHAGRGLGPGAGPALPGEPPVPVAVRRRVAEPPHAVRLPGRARAGVGRAVHAGAGVDARPGAG